MTLSPAFLYRRELEGYDVADVTGSVVPGVPQTLPEVVPLACAAASCRLPSLLGQYRLCGILLRCLVSCCGVRHFDALLFECVLT